MFRTKSVVWLLISIAFSPISVAAQERYAKFPGVGVELPQPEGYTIADDWPGLEHKATGSGVMITTMPAPYSKTSVAFTPEVIQSKGGTFHERTEATIADKPAVLVRFTQSEQGVEIGKWIGISGDEASTTMLVSFFPEELAADLSDELKSIISGARAIELKRAPLGANVDFQLGPTTKLKLASDANNSLLYTEDGQIKMKEGATDAPVLVATSSMGRQIDRENLERVALQGIMQTASVKINRVDRNERYPAGHNGLPFEICETTATGDHEKSGDPIFVYQRIILVGEDHYIIVGLVGAERRQEFAKEFSAMADGFQVVRPGDSAANGAGQLAGRGGTLTTSPPRDFPRPRPRRMEEQTGPFAPRRIEDDRPREEPAVDEQFGRTREVNGRSGRDESVRKRHTRADRLPRPKAPLGPFDYAAEAVKSAPELGSGSGQPFKTETPKGGLLVGMRVVRGDDFGGSVQAVEPIFQVGTRYRDSELQGEPGPHSELLLAPKGFAVGGVQVGAGAWTDAVRLVYMRVDGNKLVVDEREYSDWVGGDGGSTKESVSDGSLVVGLFGSVDTNLESLGLMYVVADDVRIASQEPAAKGDDDTPTQRPLRTWTSANGNFSVKARLVDSDGNLAKLMREDGRTIDVPIDKMSDADQQYLIGLE